MATAMAVGGRFSDADDTVEAIYRQAASDLGRLLTHADAQIAARGLIEAATANPRGWSRWISALLAHSPAQVAKLALDQAQRHGPSAGWIPIVRHLADAAGDVAAYRETYPETALATPSIAVEVARRYLAIGDVEAAGEVLRRAAPKPVGTQARLAAPDFDWETTWIDYLQRAGDDDAAQAVRWASFQRTLDVDRARAFVGRLDGFDDVEAESRAFAYAAAHSDFQLGLEFLMSWPALAEASQMVEARADDIAVDPEKAEAWAAKLRRRFPGAALLLLRRAAAAAFRRRQYKTCDRLTQEADTLSAPA
jgi:hypothetical protein